MNDSSPWGLRNGPITTAADTARPADERGKAQSTESEQRDARQDARQKRTDRAGRDKPAGAPSGEDAQNDSPAPEVAVCPECDRTTIERRNPGWFGRATSDHRWACWACGARFDDPNRRASRSNGTHSLTGLAKRLHDAEPDDIVTDGGRDATVPESLTALRILALLVDDSPRPDTLLRREIERHTGRECTDFGAALDSLERKGHIQRVSSGIVPTERGVIAGATEHGWLAATTGQYLVSTDPAHWPDDMTEYESERRTRIEGGDDVRTDGGTATATATARPTFDTPLSYQARCGNPDCRSLVGMSDNYCGHCGFEIDWPAAEDVDDEDVARRLLTGGNR
jgi:hypothetical protein